jgi:hypothetical protein
MFCCADSCNDAVIQYFEDTSCTTLADKKHLDKEKYTDCHPFSGDQSIEVAEGITVTLPVHYWRLRCTAQPTKPIRVDSSTLE